MLKHETGGGGDLNHANVANSYVVRIIANAYSSGKRVDTTLLA